MAEESMTDEQKRLVKLWDAYQKQEKEYSDALKKILALDKELREAHKMKKALRQLVEEKNSEIIELEVKNTSLKADLAEALPRLEEKDRTLLESKKRYAKLYALTGELEEELDIAGREIGARDKWFAENLSLLENLHKTLDQRKKMIGSAIKGDDLDSATLKIELERPDIEEEMSAAMTVVPTFIRADGPIPTAIEPEDMGGEEDAGNKRDVEDEPGDYEFLEGPEENPREPAGSADGGDAGPAPKITERPRMDVIREFSLFDSLNPTLANALYNAGYTDMGQLGDASSEDLLAVRGFDELRVESLRLDLMDVL